jgi:hypothetical protein
VAAAGFAERDWKLVLDQLAERRTAGKYELLLAEGHLARRRFGAMLGRIVLVSILTGIDTMVRLATESVYSGLE